VKRSQVLAYRLAAHGVYGSSPDDALLDLGVQDTPGGAAALALSVRGLPSRGLSFAWSFRGAPHLHRTRDLPALAAALWPLSEADAYARLAGFGTTLKKAERSGLEALALTAKAVRAVVTKETSKGDLSGRVTTKIPDAYAYWCRGCQATHVHDQLLRLAALPGGVRLGSTAPVTFVPIASRRAVPSVASGVERLVTAYLMLHGPATPADVGGFFGSSGTALKAAWPEGLAEVSVDGRKAWLPEELLPSLEGAPAPEGVRLLGPGDPYLQARDRDLLVPSKAHAKKVWTVLGNPGVLLHDGEVAGIWRAKQGGKGRLDVTVIAFGRARPDVSQEAARVATVKGASDVRVTYAD
jgi:hypothetical protein